MVVVFNKTDVIQHQFALEWMEDFEVFRAALESDNSYPSTLTRSLSLALEEFYKNLRVVGVSAVSGFGMVAFYKAIQASADEYMETYKYFQTLFVVFFTHTHTYSNLHFR
ncbi:putative GPN-loop GTPase, P-loop containing nucleoside triphosphate hydrolase [Helianthus annuus]|nr:putative GPN-loop GTPase, P-loop containing nucleoside triphosphate hydrolase [Helianthus annuus]KAJ0537720.1 putative GPN-loop GTPase, P-loop containing nucleoside triphosphate hydrolase [Helianthus annuus]KAJ0545341.1 putative GPN-loop GTPase, P-loop containing nucleoside triphosphate hydrolase [Helianthus annuus]KAJ0552300.1 putative GPN-loop GTPase, P-loop containing nucleoside triphosphate hydrolase [Helianthus annuus]KAJ0717999.1 putative GPN-loop GTPase, P-loop containing nucleoside t